MENKRTLIVDLAAVVLLIGLALAIALPRYRAGIDYGDEGFLAYGAVRVLHGQIPHRDFVSLQPPLSFYTTALVFKLFGTSLATLRNFGLSIFVALALLIYGTARSLTRPLLSFAAAAPASVLGLPLFNFVPFAVWQGIVASLFAAFLFTRAVLFPRPLWAFPAGVFTAVSLLLRHDQAIYLAISFLIFIGALSLIQDGFISRKKLRRAFLWWLAGVAVVLIPLSIFWWMQSALLEMYRQLIVFPATTYAKTSALSFPKFATEKSLPQKIAALFLFVPPGLQALAAVWLGQRIIRGRFHRREAILAFLLVWSALFYFQVLARSDLYHLLITLPPFFILAAFCWQILMESFGEMNAVKIFMSIMAVGAVCLFLRIISAITLPDITKEKEMVDLETGGVRVENGAWLSEFVRRVQSSVPPDRSILALPYQPTLYFLCERRNPTRWNYLWPGDQTPQEHVDLIEQAKHDPPAAVFVTGENEMAAYAGDILDYIHREYHRSGEFGRLTVYFPNETTP